MRLILVGILICSASLITHGQDWKRSDKKDEIETFYQTDKVGSDKFVVNIKVHNNRAKEVEVAVMVRAKHNRERPKRLKIKLPDWLPDPDLINQQNEQCTAIVPSGGSNVCSVTVTTSKVNGVKIVRWDTTTPPPRIISVKPIN